MSFYPFTLELGTVPDRPLNPMPFLCSILQEQEGDVSEEARKKALAARAEARKLQAMPYQVRKDILEAVASALLEKKEELLAANTVDLEAAERDGVGLVLKKRLKLTDEKLETLADGLRQIAKLEDPLGVVKSKRELANGLELSQITVPIGVLMIIFESRPDSMPQISALTLASGNGLLLKGGKEAGNSNAAIHKVIGDAIERGSMGAVKRDIIGLITSRGQVRCVFHEKGRALRPPNEFSSSMVGIGHACIRRCN